MSTLKRIFSVFLVIFMIVLSVPFNTFAAEVTEEDHNLEIKETKDPTCTEKGWEILACTDEDCTYEITREIPAHHTMVIKGLAPTCTTGGLTEGLYCIDCDAWVKTAESVSPLGHREETLAAVEASCTSTGLTEGTKCAVCGVILISQQVVPVKSHTPGDEVRENIIPATCTNEGSFDSVIYCTVCETELSRENNVIDMIDHTEEIVPAVESTCTETGLTEGKKCSVCGNILLEQLVTEKKDHTPSEAVSENITDATCLEPGSYDEVVYCAVCNTELIRNEKEISKLPHTEEIIAAVDSTCTETGLTEGVKCSVCGTVLVEQEVVAKKEHNSSEKVIENKIEATCLEAGKYEEVIYCVDCDVEISREEKIIPILPHTEEILLAVESTCTETGLTEGKMCTVCNTVLVSQLVTEKKDHTPVEVNNGYDATCQSEGRTPDIICVVCKQILAEGVVTDKIAHNPAEALSENVIPATCTTEGKYESVIYCSVCNEELSRQNEVISMLPHNEIVIPSVAPTCTSTGLSEGKVCSDCGEITVSQLILDKIPHNISYIGEQKDATCTEEGFIPGEYCLSCQSIIKAPQQIDKIEHEREVIPSVVATCTNTGLTQGEKCSVCGQILVEPELIDQLPHIESPISEEKVPTCTEDGHTAGIICTVCGTVIESQQIIPAEGHRYNQGIVTEATCYGKGFTTFTCEKCGISEIKDFTERTAHTLGEVVKEDEKSSTCTLQGSYDSVICCSVCKEEISREKILKPLASHTEEIIPEVKSTCYSEGLSEGKKCGVCGTITVNQEVIAKAEHTPGTEVTENVVEADCRTAGKFDTVIYCTVCNEEVSRVTTETEKRAHTEKDIQEIKPTCATFGYTLGIECAVCGTVIKEPVQTEKLPHTPSQVVRENEVDSTCISMGSFDEVVYCSVCSEELSRDENLVEKSPHKEEIIPAVESTCSVAGLSEGKKCSVCGYILVAPTSTAKKAHTPSSVIKENVVKESCTQAGSYDEVTKCIVCNKEIKRTAKTVPMLSHNIKVLPAVKEDCVNSGLTEGKKCTLCGLDLKKQTVISAKGHTPDDGRVTKAATCKLAGVKTFKCKVCNVDFKTETISKLDHDLVIVPGTKATCKKIGYTEGKKCAVCGKITVTREKTPIINHIYEDVVVKATLSKNGLKTPTCTMCGLTKTSKVVNYPKTFKLSTTSYTYNGKAKKPSVTVTDSNGKVIDSSNYFVKYSNNTEIGTATVTVTFKGDYSGKKNLNFAIGPGQVTGLKVSNEKTNSVMLSWDKMSGVSGYAIEQSTDGKTWSEVQTVNTTSATISRLTPGNKYQFRVKALNSSGKYIGKVSAVIKTAALSPAPSVTISSTASGSVTASWKKVTGATSYAVYRSYDNRTWTLVTSTTSLSYRISGLSGGSKVYVKVYATNAYGKNSPSSTVVSTTVRR